MHVTRMHRQMNNLYRRYRVGSLLGRTPFKRYPELDRGRRHVVGRDNVFFQTKINSTSNNSKKFIMEKFRVTYTNFDLKNKGIQRIKNDLKNLYWETPPKDWDNFDREIEFTQEQDRGGDCLSVSFEDTVDASFRDSMLKNLSKKSDVYSIERKISNNEYERI